MAGFGQSAVLPCVAAASLPSGLLIHACDAELAAKLTRLHAFNKHENGWMGGHGDRQRQMMRDT